MKSNNIRTIQDIDKAIALKKHQLEIQGMVIRQDVKEVFGLHASIATLISSFRKIFSK